MSIENNGVVLQLENRVQATVELIQGLKQDNRRLSKEYYQLQEKISEYEKRVTQLEELIGIAEREQKHLEKSVISALSNLDDVEELHTEESISKNSSRTTSKSSKTEYLEDEVQEQEKETTNDIFLDSTESQESQETNESLEIF